MNRSALFVFVAVAAGATILLYYYNIRGKQQQAKSEKKSAQKIHWFLLEREKNKEHLFFGVPNSLAESQLLRTFTVKTGIAGKKPTPKPQLAGRKYWLIIGKSDAKGNPETAPYFLRLDVPGVEAPPYGPVPYLECGGQCNWERAGYFGLHGVAGRPERLSVSHPGSSGCVRHKDSDIEYLYNLLEPEKEEIRYYVI